MGNMIAPCCEDGSSSAGPTGGTDWDRAETPWAAVVDGVTNVYVDIDGNLHEDANTLHICPAPGSSRLPHVPLYDGPHKQSSQLGFLTAGTPARVLEESSDGRWVHVQEETAGSNRSGWVNARSVPQQVVSRLCARADLGRPSIETVHAAFSRNGGDLTDAVKDLRNLYRSQVDGRVRTATVQAAIDSSELSPEGKAEQRSRSLMSRQTWRKREAWQSARADLV